MTKEEVVLRPFEVEEFLTHLNEIPEGVNLVEAPNFWREADDRAGTVVAILDTGVVTQHPDLKGNNLVS